MTNRDTHAPRVIRQRTCIATRTQHADKELLRLVFRKAADGKSIIVLADPARKLPGRGAWLLKEEKYLAQALERRAFQRAFRTAGPVDVTHVKAYFESTHGQ